ncbi:TPA: gamma-glutamylcyclotransferase, partial [Vibrio cholerae]|nr:gamma-glutamylcyclotransferase [Vibrio cholerae]
MIINRKSLQELIMYIFGYGSLINSASRRLTGQ